MLKFDSNSKKSIMKTIPKILSVFVLLFAGSTFAQAPDIAGMMANRADASVVPESYNFSWKYIMEIQTDNGKTMNAEYRLEKDAGYFGMGMSQGGNDVLMVMDTKNKINVTSFGKGAQKMAMASKIPDYETTTQKQGSERKFTFKSLPEKTILGYKCKGVEATDADNTIVFYFTNDAPVNFAELFRSPVTSKMPNAFKSFFKPGDKPLMMSVDITDKAKGTTMHMKCISLEKEPFVFKKSDYKFM
jgi:hypothetical protein